MGTEVAFIVEGHCEYESIPAIVGRILGYFYFPISNAKGIGNIVKNTSEELLFVIQNFQPRRIIITLDYREAERQGIVSNCVELKEKVQSNCKSFLEEQKKGSLVLPEEIVVVIADKTYESWICADYEGLKENDLFDGSLITETYSNVDIEIPNPSNWLLSKLSQSIDMKSRAHRKSISKTLRPNIAKENSRSFRKFYDEILKVNQDPM